MKRKVKTYKGVTSSLGEYETVKSTGLPIWFHNIMNCPFLTHKERVKIMKMLRDVGYRLSREGSLPTILVWTVCHPGHLGYTFEEDADHLHDSAKAELLSLMSS